MEIVSDPWHKAGMGAGFSQFLCSPSDVSNWHVFDSIHSQFSIFKAKPDFFHIASASEGTTGIHGLKDGELRQLRIIPHAWMCRNHQMRNGDTESNLS